MSSSGYDRLYHQFKDIKEEEYLIQIYRLGVLPTSYKIRYSDADPVKLSYGGGDKNSWDHTFIQGRELVFKFYVPRADIGVIDDLMESQYKDWYVEFSKGSTTLFFGFVKPENMYKRFETNPPYIEVELSATDGLAELKDIDFSDPGAYPVNTRVTLLDAIRNALTPINIILPFKIQVNTFPSEFIGYTLTTCPISEAYCNLKRFYNITIEEGEEIFEPIKCWDVIEYCLKTFNCKLFQHEGYYVIINHLELVKNQNSLTHIFDWYDLVTPTSSTTETNIFKDISDSLFKPYVEQQKIHPLKSITSSIVNTNAGESVGVDFSDWENVWEFSNKPEEYWDSHLIRSDNALRCMIVHTDQPWMRLKTVIHVIPEEGKTLYLRFKGDFYCWYWNKWDGNIFKSDGKLSQTDIRIRIQKDGIWSPYLSFGSPVYSPDVNGVEVPAYKTFDTKANINLRINKEADYNVEFNVNSLRGEQQFDALGIQLKNFEITLWDGAGNEYNPTEVNSAPTYNQVNIENTGYEDLEQELQLFDGLSLGDTAALMMRKGSILYLTSGWDRRGGTDNRAIIDINSIYILNNRSIYKNFLKCTIIDRDFLINYTDILIIQTKYYAFSSYSRNFLTGDIEAELIQLVHDSRAYPTITTVTKTATILEPIVSGTPEGEKINIAVLKSAPITQFQVGDVIRAVEDSSGIEYYLAQADSLEHATAIGIVTEIVDTDIFKYISNGYLPKEIFPCEVGQYYWLSPTEAGKLTTEPTYKEYEIEQAIGFGTEKGFYVEIDARNLNFKEVVEKSLQSIQGIYGMQGIQGVQGITGSQGIQGVQGTIGLQGAVGTQGLTGNQGLTGAQGAIGTGTQGIQGLQGRQGLTGTGTQGATGTQGSTGATGTGTQGVQGIQGVTGSQGQSGIQGFTGIQGATGAQGGQGIIGSGYGGTSSTYNNVKAVGVEFTCSTQKGMAYKLGDYVKIRYNSTTWMEGTITYYYPNDTMMTILVAVSSGTGYYSSWTISLAGAGTQGIQGVQGTQGVQGRQGTQGIQGLTGAGTQGTTGIQGYTGIQGIQGTQGLQGRQGTIGIQGILGVQGLQGLQGIQGFLGLQGLYGVQGLTGAQGLQGIKGDTFWSDGSGYIFRNGVVVAGKSTRDYSANNSTVELGSALYTTSAGKVYTPNLPDAGASMTKFVKIDPSTGEMGKSIDEFGVPLVLNSNFYSGANNYYDLNLVTASSGVIWAKVEAWIDAGSAGPASSEIAYVSGLFVNGGFVFADVDVVAGYDGGPDIDIMLVDNGSTYTFKVRFGGLSTYTSYHYVLIITYLHGLT